MLKENLVGRTIAGYTLERQVGEGGTSTVFRAVHPTHGTVAVKVLKQKLRKDATAVARFLREASYGDRVKHANVIRTIETGEPEPGLHFLATEWAPGELLETHAKRVGPMPLAEVVPIVEQIATAVGAVHDAGLVHRDLKPDNLMYDSASGAVKLLDFGIAADTDADPAQRLTRAGFFVGTLLYVAPETLSGELVGPAADQYSLATITYFLLTATHPFTSRNPREMFAQLLSEDPVPLNRARAELRFNDGVERVIMRGLSKNPEGRYPSPAEFARSLRAAAEGHAGAGGEGTGAEQTGVFGRMRSIFKRA